MGNKPSNIFQMDRPESGGSDRKDEREASGLLDKSKQEFAEAESRKRSKGKAHQRDTQPGNASARRKATGPRKPAR